MIDFWYLLIDTGIKLTCSLLNVYFSENKSSFNIDFNKFIENYLFRYFRWHSAPIPKFYFSTSTSTFPKSFDLRGILLSLNISPKMLLDTSYYKNTFFINEVSQIKFVDNSITYCDNVFYVKNNLTRVWGHLIGNSLENTYGSNLKRRMNQFSKDSIIWDYVCKSDHRLLKRSPSINIDSNDLVECMHSTDSRVSSVAKHKFNYLRGEALNGLFTLFSTLDTVDFYTVFKNFFQHSSENLLTLQDICEINKQIVKNSLEIVQAVQYLSTNYFKIPQQEICNFIIQNRFGDLRSFNSTDKISFASKIHLAVSIQYPQIAMQVLGYDMENFKPSFISLDNAVVSLDDPRFTGLDFNRFLNLLVNPYNKVNDSKLDYFLLMFEFDVRTRVIPSLLYS